MFLSIFPVTYTRDPGWFAWRSLLASTITLCQRLTKELCTGSQRTQGILTFDTWVSVLVMLAPKPPLARARHLTPCFNTPRYGLQSSCVVDYSYPGAGFYGPVGRGGNPRTPCALESRLPFLQHQQEEAHMRGVPWSQSDIGDGSRTP